MATFVNIFSEGDILPGEVGVFVRTVGRNTAIRGNTNKTLGIIADFPWGPENEWTEITSAKDLLETFFPFGLHTFNDAFSDLAGVPFGRIKVYNAKAGDAVKATYTFGDDDTPTATNSLVATAKYFGTGGNGITVAPSGAGAVVRSVTSGTTVMWFDAYSAVQASNGTVTDPSDPLVTYAKASGADEWAAVATHALAGGSSGTMTAAILLAGLDAGVGDENIDVFVFAGVSTSLIDAVRLGAVAFADDNPDKIVVLPSLPTSDDADAAVTDIADYRGAFENVWASFPRGEVRVSYSFRGYTTATTIAGRDLAVDLACCLQRVPPWTAAMRKNVKDFTFRIVSLAESMDRATLAGLAAAGITTWVRSPSLGGRITPYSEVVTTVTTSNTLSGQEEAIDGVATRYRLYVKEAVANFLEAGLGDPLDVDLANLTLGNYSAAKVGAITAFMENERVDGHVVAGLNSDGTPAPAYYVDAFGQTTQEDLNGGRWTIALSGRRTPHAKQFILNLAISAGQDIFVSVR